MSDQIRTMRAESAPGAEVRLEGLSKAYGGNAPAVHDVSLTVESGSFVTLLGPSGSGKTTTLNIIAGFVQQSSGRVLIDGEDVDALPAHKRDLGFVFQNYALFPHMTVEGNIAYPLRRRRIARGEISKRVREILEVVQMGELAQRKPSELSGGQQQRVALARALVFRPRALLLDEPLAALDRQLRGALQDELKQLHRNFGTTIVLVTHDQQEAFNLSDRVAVFNRGTIEQEGSPHELYERPETEFVARFLGESTVVHGVVAGEGEIRVGGAVLSTASTAAFERGARVCVVIRPEHVELAQRTEAPRSGARHSGRIIDTSYLGGTTRVAIELAPGLVVWTIASYPGGGACAPGDEVEVTWRPEHLTVVRAAGSSSAAMAA